MILSLANAVAVLFFLVTRPWRDAIRLPLPTPRVPWKQAASASVSEEGGPKEAWLLHKAVLFGLEWNEKGLHM